MARRSYRPEEIINKLREAGALLSQGSTVRKAARKIGKALAEWWLIYEAQAWIQGSWVELWAHGSQSSWGKSIQNTHYNWWLHQRVSYDSYSKADNFSRCYWAAILSVYVQDHSRIYSLWQGSWIQCKGSVQMVEPYNSRYASSREEVSERVGT